VFDGRKQESTEAPALGPDGGKQVLFQQAGEEVLRQIAGLMLIPAVPADVGVEREPVSLAEGRERLLSFRRGALAR
jgi:hypothetical protein